MKRDEYKRDWRYPPPEQPSAPDRLLESWPFLLLALIVACSLLWAAAQGWIP